MVDAATNSNNRPDFQTAAYQQMSPTWTLVGDVSGGTSRIQACGETYLPKEPAEKPDAYQRRLKRSRFFNVYSRTRNALVGMVFKSDPQLDEDVPDNIKQHLENVDLAGTHIDVFAKNLFTDAFEGHAFILVDMQPALPAGSTLADERAANRRPFWVKYRACQAVNWRTEVINGETVLTQITFEENSHIPAGEFGETAVTKYRVFRLVDGVVTWSLYRKVTEQGKEEIILDPVTPNTGTVSVKRIPVAVVYGNRKGLLVSEPPLLDLAHLNIDHYQQNSDYRAQLHALIPILVRKGVPEELQEKLIVGPGTIADVPTDGELKYISHDGKAIEATRQAITDLEQRMGALGLAMLTAKDETNTKTATEIRSNDIQQTSDLATMARSLQDALELALQFHAEYLGLESGGSIKLGVAESDLVLDGSMLGALSNALSKLQISPEYWVAVLKRAFPGIEVSGLLDFIKANPFKGGQPAGLNDMLKGAGSILNPPAPPVPPPAQ
jgi:hypothetical protein